MTASALARSQRQPRPLSRCVEALPYAIGGTAADLPAMLVKRRIADQAAPLRNVAQEPVCLLSFGATQ